MKNIPLFATRVIILLIIAGIISTVVGVILIFIFGNLNSVEQNEQTINAISSTVFGVLFGYKLNDLVQEFRK